MSDLIDYTGIMPVYPIPTYKYGGIHKLVCMAVNQMKSDLTIEQLKYFCKSILEYK